LQWYGVDTAYRVKQLQDQIFGQIDLTNLSYSKTIDLDLEISKWQAINETKFDTFVLNVSPLGESKTWDTEDDWNRGAFVDTVATGGTLTLT
jgi:hypothetical protein